MRIHTNPYRSDGIHTIGYDDDGLAGIWDGNMAQFCDDRDFAEVLLGYPFHDGIEEYFVEEGQDGLLYWGDEEGNSVPINVILRAYGSK